MKNFNNLVKLNQIKNLNLEKLIIYTGILYMFFLSRRGGDSKDKVALIIMILIFLQSLLTKNFQKYKKYRAEIFFGIIYMSLVSVSYFFSDFKSPDRFYTYLHSTLYSLGFLFVSLNFKMNKKYIKYILPVLILISIPPLSYGVVDFICNYRNLAQYRIAGDSYTTKYALDLGIYFLIGIFNFYYYKNKYIRLMLFLYLIIITILIMGTQSRNTFLMLPISLAFVVFFKNYKKGIIVMGLLFLAGLFLIKSPIKINNIERIKNSIISVEKVKKDARYLLFKEGIEISKNNILKGEGFFRYKGKDSRSTVFESYEHYHNIFIETAVTQGILTLISYFLFLVLLFYRLLKNYFLEKDKLKKNIKLLTLAIFIFSHLYGLAEPIFYFEKLYQLIFTIITISIVIDEPNDKIIKEGR